MKYVVVKLTAKEAAELYSGAMVHGEELNTEEHYGRGGGREAATFWRAIDKLQAARYEQAGLKEGE